MTHDEKVQQMTARNEAICRFYADDHTLAECGKKFGLKRQRIQQILQAAGVWRQYARTGRNKHLGVTVSEEDKMALTAEAKRRGVSVSSLTADTIREMLAGLPRQEGMA